MSLSQPTNRPPSSGVATTAVTDEADPALPFRTGVATVTQSFRNGDDVVGAATTRVVVVTNGAEHALPGPTSSVMPLGTDGECATLT